MRKRTDIFNEAPGPSRASIAGAHHGPACVNCGCTYTVTTTHDDRLWCSFCGGYADTKRHAW